MSLLTLTAFTIQLTASPVIYLGLNGANAPNGQVQILAGDGTVLGSFGADNASAAAIDASGRIFTVTPGDNASTINVYDFSQNLLSSFTFNSGTDNGNGAPDYITDMAYGGGNTLWISGFNGIVYHIDLSGSILSSFDSGNLFTGVGFDGSNVYTTAGQGGSSIFEWTTGGVLESTISTGLSDAFGIGFDSANSTFWVGGQDLLSNLGSDGSLISAIAFAGQQTGVEVADVTQGGEVPEPSSLVLLGAGVLGIAVFRFKKLRLALIPGLAAFLGIAQLQAAVSINSLTPSVNSPEPVATTVTWTVSATDGDAGELWYRFRVSSDGITFHTLVDFGPSNTFTWAQTDSEGSYTFEVTVRNRTTGTSATTSVPYTITPRVTGGTPVVTNLANPLVALYSAPACPVGSTMRVRYKRAVDMQYQTTPSMPCKQGVSMNFLIGGMYMNSTYDFRHDVTTGPRITTVVGPSFTTGSASPGQPVATLEAPPQQPTSLSAGMLAHAPLNDRLTYTTDLLGNLLWFYTGNMAYMTRPVPGGGFFVLYGLSTDYEHSGFRQIDLAGDTLRETNVVRLNEQLQAAGQDPIIAVHHDVRQLPNGNLLLLGMVEKILPSGDTVGDMIIVLDGNMNLLWTWNIFNHLDPTTSPSLNGGTCATGSPICPIHLAPTALDWTHCNSLALTPDGNLLLSVRHLDHVLKINYSNGSGDGSIIWTLGKNGDFTIQSNDPYPWFSHQHDVEYESANVISLFDNGNTRIGALGGGNSRGQVLQIDETNRTVSLIVNQDVGTQSLALGSAQRLPNGNYHFHSGIMPLTDITEYTPAGSLVYRIHFQQPEYRSFRMKDLYSGSF